MPQTFSELQLAAKPPAKPQRSAGEISGTANISSSQQPREGVLYTCDNLAVLRGLDDAYADLIYLDPPFNSRRVYLGRGDFAPAAFSDVWVWDETLRTQCDKLSESYPLLGELIGFANKIHSEAMGAYLAFLAPRLIEMLRVLKPTGSLWLHCDQSASHYLKLCCDIVFGRARFVNEIAWMRTNNPNKGGGAPMRKFGTHSDHILVYAKGRDYYFDPQYVPPTDRQTEEAFPYSDERGKYRTNTSLWCSATMRATPSLCYEYNGMSAPYASGWRVSRERLAELDAANEIIWRQGRRPLRKIYLDEGYRGWLVGNVWTDIGPVSGGSREAQGYPTQKPVALLSRVIETGCPPGGLVLDPFCGSGTTCVAAERLRREWVGIDVCEEAGELVKARLQGVADEEPFLKMLDDGIPVVRHETKPPQRSVVDVTC